MGFAIGGFRSVLGVSVFQGSLLVIVIMIDGSEKRNCSHVCEKRSNKLALQLHLGYFFVNQEPRLDCFVCFRVLLSSTVA